MLPVAVVLGLFVLGAILIVARFLKHHGPGSGKRIETFSGIWTLSLYLILGAVPLLSRVAQIHFSTS